MSDSKIVLGLWPIAGITTIGVTDQDARATIRTAIDAGVTAFDTAYSYGFAGESDRWIGEFVRGERDRFTVLGKVGQRWNDQKQRIVDGSVEQLTLDAEESLRRMQLECIDVLFLHSPDPHVPITESAAAMLQLKTRGLCRQIGICNASPEQIEQFASVVAPQAIQCPLNLIQRDVQRDLIPRSHAAGRDVFVFWTLMKGLLAGKISRDHRFADGDSRPGYAIFQGESRRRVHDLIDRLRPIGQQMGQSIAQLSIGWAISQPGVSAALVGARRPEQILESTGARVMTAETLDRIEKCVADCMTADAT